MDLPWALGPPLFLWMGKGSLRSWHRAVAVLQQQGLAGRGQDGGAPAQPQLPRGGVSPGGSPGLPLHVPQTGINNLPGAVLCCLS